MGINKSLALIIFFLQLFFSFSENSTIQDYLLNKSEKFRVIGMGEGNNHDIQNNFDILELTLERFIKKYSTTYLFIEIGEEYQIYVDNYLSDGKIDVLKRNCFINYQLIKYVYDLNKRFNNKIIIKSGDGGRTTRERDFIIWKKLEGLYNTLGADERILYYYGDYHVRTKVSKSDKKFFLGNSDSDSLKTYFTAGEYIKKNIDYDYYYCIITNDFSKSNALKQLSKYMSEEQTVDAHTKDPFSYKIKRIGEKSDYIIYDDIPVPCTYPIIRDKDFVYGLLSCGKNTLVESYRNYLVQNLSMITGLHIKATGEKSSYDEVYKYKEWIDKNYITFENDNEESVLLKKMRWEYKAALVIKHLYMNDSQFKVYSGNFTIAKKLLKLYNVESNDYRSILSLIDHELDNFVYYTRWGYINSFFIKELIAYLKSEGVNIAGIENRFKSVYAEKL